VSDQEAPEGLVEFTTETLTVPVIHLDNRQVAAYYHDDTTPSDDTIVNGVLYGLDPAQVESRVRQMLEEFRRMDGQDHGDVGDIAHGDDHTYEGSLLLLQGLDVEVRIEMRRRAAVVPYDTWSEEDRERVAGTVFPSSMGNLLAERRVPVQDEEAGDE